MRKINTRGIESANKVMLMAAIAYNLKKLLKHNENYRVRHAMELNGNSLRRLFSTFSEAIYLKMEQFLSRYGYSELNLATFQISF